MERIEHEDGTLHLVVQRDPLRTSMLSDSRNDCCHHDECLQVAQIQMPCGKTFRPHSHIRHDRQTTETQEVWVVVSGRVRADYYNMSGVKIASRELFAGDVSITHRGGHNYTCLESAYVVEVKNGPYGGVEKDKVQW